MPIVLPNGQVVDPDGRLVSGNPRNPQTIFPGVPGEPAPGIPPQQGQQPQQQQKAPPDQFISPPQPGDITGLTAQPVPDPRFITEPTDPGNNLFNFGPFPSNDLGPSQGSLINDQITNALLGQDPFPSELVPPFRVRPGLNGGTTADSILGGGLGSGFQQAVAGQANVDLSQFGATTREVQDEELVSNQLNNLLQEDGAFIQNALQRGRELAQDRGALSSSIFAGASQRAAIDAALPIASADAQAFQRAASENMAALNQNTLAKLQASTNIAISNASNRTQASATNAQVSGRLGEARLQFEAQRIANDARERIAETQLNAQFAMQQGQFAQQTFMERLQQQGRIDITQLGGAIQAELQSRGFQQEIDLNNLSQANLIEIQERFLQPRFDANLAFNRGALQSQLGIQAMNIFGQGMASMNGLDLDDAARARGQQFWTDLLQRSLGFAQSAGDPDAWDDFNFNFGG